MIFQCSSDSDDDLIKVDLQRKIRVGASLIPYHLPTDLRPEKTLSSTATMRIDRKSTLTPISGCLSPGHGLLCVELVDRRLEDLITLGENERSVLRSFYATTAATTTAVTTAVPSTRTTISPHASPITTIIPPLPFDISPHASPIGTAASPLPFRIRNTKRKRRPVCNNIASRLPVRSQATIHRRPHTTIARNLLPRTANRATYNRQRAWANLDHTPHLRT